MCSYHDTKIWWCYHLHHLITSFSSYSWRDPSAHGELQLPPYVLAFFKFVHMHLRNMRWIIRDSVFILLVAHADDWVAHVQSHPFNLDHIDRSSFFFSFFFFGPWRNSQNIPSILFSVTSWHAGSTAPKRSCLLSGSWWRTTSESGFTGMHDGCFSDTA